MIGSFGWFSAAWSTPAATPGAEALYPDSEGPSGVFARPYHATVKTPRMPVIQLKTRATIPLEVKLIFRVPSVSAIFLQL